MSDPIRKPRYITPETLMKLRFGERARPRWDVGVLCFRGPGGCAALVQALGARPVRAKAFYAIDETLEPSDVHELTLGGRRIVVVSRCLWGGPQTAILVEELAAFGVRIVVGYGVAGSLAPELPKGTQIVAATGIVTDGTSRAYTPLGEVAADPSLMTMLSAAAAGLGIELRPVRVATVDALYQETPDDVRGWLGRGARAINMETAPLYAAAEVCEMRSVWLGHISDSLSLDGAVWESWQRPAAMTDVTVALTAGLLDRLA